MRASSAAFAMLILLAVLGPAGCSQLQAPQDDGSGSISLESTPSPGIVRLDDGQITAVGTLVYERKGERFVLVNASPNRALTGKETLVAAVAESTQSNVDLIGLVGAYLEVSGVAIESTLTAIPELGVESIRIISLPEDRPASPGSVPGTSSP